MARPPPCIQDRARRALLKFRKEQQVFLSPYPGLGSYGWKAASFESRAADHCPASKARDLIDLISAGGRTAPLSVARRRAAPRRCAAPPPYAARRQETAAMTEAEEGGFGRVGQQW